MSSSSSFPASSESESEERYPYLTSYAKALAEHRERQEAAKWLETPYHTRPGYEKITPKCSSCNLYFNNVISMKEYVCSKCGRTISYDDIENSPYNLNSNYYKKNKKKNI
jgi:protein-arginine kinase activator protein McsA